MIASNPVTLVALGAVTVAVLAVLVPAVAVSRPPLRVLLGAYAFVLPFGSAVELPGIPAPFNSLSSLVGMAVGAFFVLHLMVERRARDWPATAIAWLMLTGWVGLTAVWSVDAEQSVSRYPLLLSLVALYAVASLLPVTPGDIRWAEVALVAGATAVSVYAVFLAATNQLSPGEDARLPRFAIETGDPNITAASLILPWVLAAWAGLNAARGRDRLLGMIAATTILAGIVLTGSRGALVALALSFVVIIVFSPGRGRLRALPYLAVMAVAAIVAFLSAPAGLQDHLADTGSTGRTQIWRAALASCSSGCWVGHGWATFGDVYRTTYLSDLSVEGFGDRDWAAHNIAIGMLVDAGVVGLVLLAAGFALLYRDLLRLPAAVAGPAVAALTGLLAANMLLSNVSFKYFWFTLLYGTLVVTTHTGGRALLERRPADAHVP